MDFPFDNLGNDSLGLGATPSKVESSYSEKMLLSFFARGNYNYDNRYLLTATVRADGSTVFSNKDVYKRQSVFYQFESNVFHRHGESGKRICRCV